MKSLVIAALLSLSVFCSSVVAGELSGRYLLNTNGFKGYIDLNISGSSVSGEMVWFVDANGQRTQLSAKIKKGRISRTDKSIYIYFVRVGNPQEYHGWFSFDKSMIAGYFGGYKNSNIKYPWVATK